MILSEQYRLVSQAKSKLTKEARRIDPDLRVMVVHANVLDGLMDEIQRGREQRQKNLSVKFDTSIETQKAAAESKNYDNDDYYSDSSSDEEEEDDSDDYDSDEEEEEEEHEIAYTTNKSCQQMPVLDEEEELPYLTYSSESEDEDDESPEEDITPSFQASTTSIHKVPLSTVQPLQVA